MIDFKKRVFLYRREKYDLVIQEKEALLETIKMEIQHLKSQLQ